MNTNKNVDFDPLKQMMSGVEAVATAVGKTLGAGGQNVLIQTPNGFPHITKDGVTVAKEINFKDPVKQMGVEILRQAAVATYNKVGDATSTTTVLSHALIKNGVESEVINKIELKRALERVSEEAVNFISAISKPCDNVEDVVRIATVSANGDTHLGSLIGQSVFTVGKNGQFDIEHSQDGTTSVEMVGGYKLGCRVANIDFLRGQAGIQFENPMIVVTSKKILRQSDVEGLIQTACIDNERPLVIICDEVGGEALQTLLVNAKNNDMPIIALIPNFQGLPVTLAEHIMYDIATYVGAKYIPNDNVLELGRIDASQYGSCGRVKVGNGFMVMVEPTEEREQFILDRVKVIEEMSKTEETYAWIHKQRISALLSSICVIKLHGFTPSELNEKKDAIDDAIKACRAAMEGGYVAGAGTALYFAGKAIENVVRDNYIDKEAARLLSESFKTPMTKIAENAGFSERLTAVKSYGQGVNAKTGLVVDLFNENIIDPTLGVVYAIRSAVSVAGLFLTTACAITNDESGQ